MSDNVIPLLRKKKQNSGTSEAAAAAAEALDQVMERNKENQERLRKERLDDTKKVLRSYRIKG